jgi:hypothetical protein
MSAEGQKRTSGVYSITSSARASSDGGTVRPSLGSLEVNQIWLELDGQVAWLRSAQLFNVWAHAAKYII